MSVRTDNWPKWICTGCAKVISNRPISPWCQDCGGFFREATQEDLECDKCGDPDGKRLFNREQHDRLCRDCIEEEIR